VYRRAFLGIGLLWFNHKSVVNQYSNGRPQYLLGATGRNQPAWGRPSAINADNLPHANQSILAAGSRLGIPVTVHVAIGTDILHMHPDFDAEATGRASHRDFRTLAAIIATLEQGVYLNVGSAVILPEVFLKALTVARNLGHTLTTFTTVNIDFIRHYRPATNVVDRPTAQGGQGFNLTGHHEIMLPLIAAGVIEQIQ